MMVNPGGTGRPARLISARPEPLPPSVSFMVPSPSAVPPPNMYTYLLMRFRFSWLRFRKSLRLRKTPAAAYEAASNGSGGRGRPERSPELCRRKDQLWAVDVRLHLQSACRQFACTRGAIRLPVRLRAEWHPVSLRRRIS